MSKNHNILLLSDLHIHVSNMDINCENSDIILILGDLTYDNKQLMSFFSYKIPEDKLVIFVPGNHDYEGRNFYKRDDELRDLLSCFDNVKFLQNDSFVYDNIRFLGTTLWTDFSLYEPTYSKQEIMKLSKQGICDFSTIFGKDNKLFTPEEAAKAHEEAVKWLTYKLKKESFNGTTCVLSHFLPHPNSINEKHKNDLLNAYFCSNLEHLMGFSEYWFHGHTHQSCQYNLHGTDVICNPRGYSKTFNLSENIHFDPLLNIKINKRTQTLTP